TERCCYAMRTSQGSPKQTRFLCPISSYFPSYVHGSGASGGPSEIRAPTHANTSQAKRRSTLKLAEPMEGKKATEAGPLREPLVAARIRTKRASRLRSGMPVFSLVLDRT